MKSRSTAALWHLIIAVVVMLSLLGCGSSSPAPASSSPAASSKSPAASTAASPASSPAASPASSPAAAGVDPEWQKVIDAAKKEGKLTIYGTWSEAEINNLTEGFGKLYPGIQLEFVNQRGAEALAKLTAEQAAGKNLADIIRGGGPTAREAAQKGLTLEFVPPEAKKAGVQWLIDPMSDSKELGGNKDVIQNVTPYHILINTDLIKPADEPKSFKDLVDPKYKGKIAFDDPRMDGPGNRAFSLLYKQYGEDWIKQFIANGLTIVTDYYGDPKRVAAGQYQILVMPTAQMADPVLDQGLPVKLLNPSEGNPLLANILAILKEAPHPNAAKLFANFVLTKEGQQAEASAGGTPIRSDVSAKRPEFDIKGKTPFPGTPTNYETETVYFKQMAQKAKDMMGQ